MQGADRETSSRIEELAPKHLGFVTVSEAQATELIVANHYLHRSCNIRWAWGIEVDREILGVLTVGSLGSPTATRGVIGETEEASRNPFSRSKDVFELNRLWVSDSLPVSEVQGTDRKTGNPRVHRHGVESKFIGWCLHQLKKEYPNIILISYADGSKAHVGYVYQATNWIYTGMTLPFKNRTRKHRYCWFANPEDKQLLKGEWAPKPYPRPLRA